MLWHIPRLCRTASTSAQTPKTVSNVKWKLDHFVETGQLFRLSETEKSKKIIHKKRKSARVQMYSGISPQKALLLIRARYDGVELHNHKGESLDVHKMRPGNLNRHDPKSLELFRALAEVRSVSRKKLDDRVIMALLGVSAMSVKDSYFVTRDVLHLLETDQDIARALEVCRLAKANASVALNAIVDWCLSKSKLDLAKKVMATRKKWGIPVTDTTYVVYFNGIASMHEWGAVSDKMAQEVVDTMTSGNVPRNIETYNAALKLLVKNYSNDQALAWGFFDELAKLHLRPDCQTFTTLIQGSKRLFSKRAEEVRANPRLSANERVAQLHSLQSRLISMANLVLEKVLIAATPPVPPTKDQVLQSPELLTNYKAATRFPPMDIDQHFVTTILSCYTDGNFGTSWSNNSGSHYKYHESVLLFLQAWVPEIREIVDFITKTPGSSTDASPSLLPGIRSLEASPDVKRKTNLRITAAKVAADIQPDAVLKTAPLLADLNPLVKFPPSPFSKNKTAAIYSGVEKPLVDFTRPKFADVYREFSNESKTKLTPRGQRSSARSMSRTKLTRRESAINKFLLRIFLDSLIKIGQFTDFYRAMWYSINRWGGINIDTEKLSTASGLHPSALPKEDFPKMAVETPEKVSIKGEGITASKAQGYAKSSEIENVPIGRSVADSATAVNTSTDTDINANTNTRENTGTGTNRTDVAVKSCNTVSGTKTRSHSKANTNVIDIGLVEDFLFKIEENYPHKSKASALVCELLAAFSNTKINKERELFPRPATFNAVFSILNRDIYRFNDQNRSASRTVNEKRAQPDNTPKHSLTVVQLHELLDALQVLLSCICSRFNSSHMDNFFVQSYNALVSRICSYTWTDAPDSHNSAAVIHKKIIHTGILMWRPKRLIDNRLKQTYADSILPSMEFVLASLDKRSDLVKHERDLMMCLKGVLKMNKAGGEFEEFERLQSRIHKLSS